MRDRDITLECIQQQRRNGQSLGTGARDIGGADVAAAGLADVLSAKDADQQVAEWDRAQQVGDRDDDKAMVVKGMSKKRIPRG